jgi:serine phosphatase RsbU (regulator of sigma subunit)
LSAFQGLLTGSHQARPEDLPALGVRAAELLDAQAIIIYLVDYGQLNLSPLAGGGTRAADILRIDGTLAGRAYALTETYEANTEAGHRTWIPLLNGSNRLGVLEVRADAAPSVQLREHYHVLADLLAELLVTRHSYSDVVELTRRTAPMQLPAEIVWNLLPPPTFTGPRAAISAILEPCYDVGGDAFDYAANGHTLHAAIFDTVGHGIEACALTSLTLNAYRNARRCGLDLVDTYRSIDKWVTARHPGSFVTALLTELDTVHGRYRRICAGHPGELLMRDGKAVRTLPGPTAMPLGLAHLSDSVPRVDEEALQPGDQLLLYTDGVIEARTAEGEFFGHDRLADFLARALTSHLSAPETLRRLIQAILHHQHEQLQDDASAVLVQWPPTYTDTATARDLQFAPV